MMPQADRTPPSSRVNITLWILVGILAAAVVTTALQKGLPLLYPELLEVGALERPCDLRQSDCEVRFQAGGRVRFAIEPRSIPLVTPLALRVELTGFDAESVEVNFAGVDMNMGFNRVRLEAQGGGRFGGQGTLPVCVRDRMEWEARVLIATPDGILAAPFRFTTDR